MLFWPAPPNLVPPAQREPRAGNEHGERDARERDVFADGAGEDRVTLGLQLLDLFQGKEAKGAQWTAVIVVVVVEVTAQPLRGDRAALYWPLRHPAEGCVDLMDVTFAHVLPFPQSSFLILYHTMGTSRAFRRLIKQ